MVNPTKRWKLTALAFLGLTGSNFLCLQAQTETVTPQEYTGRMRNPLMGFREGQRSGTPGQKNLASQAAGKLADLSAHPYCVLVRDYIHYNVDPLTAAAADLPMLGDDVASAGPVKIRYRRAKNLSDVTLTPMTSTTLRDRQPANVLQSTRVMDGGKWELLEISLPDPPAGRIFFKMQAQQTP